MTDIKNFSLSTLWRQRLGYGIADLGCNLIWQMLTIYLMFFYTEIMGLTAVQVSLLLLITRLADGAFDLLMGYIIDNTNTRWGKSRPYFLWGAIPFGILSMLVFYVPKLGMDGKLIYCYITYTALSLCYTIVNMPLTAILPSLTTDLNERTVLASSRILFSFMGATIVAYKTMDLVKDLGHGLQSDGFFNTMILYGITAAITLLITFGSVKEHKAEIKRVTPQTQSLLLLLRNTPWMLFAGNIIFMWGAYFLQQASLVYFYTYNIQKPELLRIILTLSAVVPIAGTIAAPLFSRVITKRNVFLIASAIHLSGILLIAASGLNISGIITGATISALGFGLRHAIYFSMQADPVDFGEWKTDVNSAGMIAAANQFIGKIAMAGGGALAGLLLTEAGYVPHHIQSAATQYAIRMNFICIPAGMIVVSMLILCFYDLDKILPQIQDDLKEGSRSAAN